MEKYEQFQYALAEVGQIKGLDSYHTIFLGTMVLRKLRHPEEGLREITAKTMQTMGTRYGSEKLEEDDEALRTAAIEAVNQTEETYGKKNLVSVSTAKCLDGLEKALEDAELPADLKLEGETVKCVFMYLTRKLRDKMESLA